MNLGLTIINCRKASIWMGWVAIMPLLWPIASLHATETERITTSVEIRHVQPLLRRVSHVAGQGFERLEADKLAARIRTMPANQPMSWSYTVKFHGAEQPLQVRALLDELGTVDLDFSTSPVLASALRLDIDNYLNAHNL